MGDTSYSAARFCGFCHTKLDENLGLGIFNGPKNLEPEYISKEYSHGDNGVFIVDVDTWEVQNIGGYEEKKKFTLDKTQVFQ